ncbi:MAG: hypothetical protein K6B40_00810 [Firmicutes bacterium]|nr:hypothetical protein [Bacillota bacterium]
MKKTMLILLAIFTAALLLAGCGHTGGDSAGGGENQGASVDSLKTIGDILALGIENQQYTCYEDAVIYAFELDGVYYRARADISPETFEAVMALDYSDEQYNEKYNALEAPLPIRQIEDLSRQILSRDQLDALRGKTGQDLLDEGWYSSGHNLETMEFWMNYGPFLYNIAFDGHVDEADYESFDDETDILDLTVKSAEFLALGDATDMEEE